MRVNSRTNSWSLPGLDGRRFSMPRLIIPSAFEQKKSEAAQGLPARLAAEVILASDPQLATLIMGTGTMAACMGVKSPDDATKNRQKKDPAGTAPSLYDIHEEINSLLAARSETREFRLLINTSRSKTASEAVENALSGLKYTSLDPLLSRFPSAIKMEVFDQHLIPANRAVLAAVFLLRNEAEKSGVILPPIIPFITKDWRAARVLVEELGCPALRIYGSTIGRNQGIDNPRWFQAVVQDVNVPIIAEGGLATPAQVARAFQLGASACLVNSAIRQSADPVAHVQALRAAIETPGRIT